MYQDEEIMYKTSCDMDICIYNENGRCLLDTITVSGGACDSCIYVALPEKILNIYKAKQLQGQYDCEND